MKYLRQGAKPIVVYEAANLTATFRTLSGFPIQATYVALIFHPFKFPHLLACYPLSYIYDLITLHCA